MSDKKDLFSRRNLLKGLGATCAMSLIHERMVDQIVGSFVGSAQAAPGMLTDFRYVNFSTSGGLPRWYFDLPIVPNGNDPYVANKQVITSMKMGSDNNPVGEYAHTKMGKFYLPLMWSYSIPLSNGGVGKLNELASSGLFIRGIDQVVDGHTISLLRQNNPIPGSSTYSGIFADSGETPIPVGRGGGGFEHRSARNKAMINFSYQSDLKVMSNAFNSFKTTDPISFNRRDMAQRTIEAAVKAIQKNQGSSSPFMSSVKSNRDNAMELLSSDFNTIDSEYQTLYKKYQSLILAAAKMPLPGVTTNPIYATSGDPRFNIYVPELAPHIGASTLTGDIRIGFENLIPHPLFAHSFALAEFLITKNLSSSVVTSLGFWSNFDLLNYNLYNDTTLRADILETKSRKGSLGVDAHATGTFPALIMFTRHFHAYATCLHELMTVLKAKNLYDQTLIHTTSDFNRSPRINGGGADHGYTGCATSIFTGRVKETLVVGNIAQGSKSGTWGVATSNDNLGGRRIILGNVASTICSIFDLPTPAKNDASLVTLGPNKTVLTPKDKPKNVA